MRFIRFITLFFLLQSFIYAEPQKDEPIKRSILAGLILSSWVSAGISEGTKWQTNNPGNTDFIWKGDYHVYRAVSGVNLITIPILALNMDKSKDNIKTVLISNIMGWAIYEGMISWIGYGDFRDRGDFRILNTKIPKPSPINALFFAAMTSIEIEYCF